MSEWTFSLDALAIDEPQGFADMVLRAKRDDVWHGIFFEASTSELQFYGAAFDYLLAKKESLGFDGDVTFTATTQCGGEDAIFEGKLDFRQFKRRCGTDCYIYMPVEQEGCLMTLRNRYDQKVDMDNFTSFNGLTVIPEYSGLNFEMELAAQEMQARIEGYVADGGEVFNMDIFPNDERGKQYAVRPDYSNAIIASINTTQLTPTVQAASDNGLNDSVLSPILLLDQQDKCYRNEMPYEGRMKGSTRFCLDDDGGGPNASFGLHLIVAKGNDVPFGTITILHQDTIFDNVTPAANFEFFFDFSFSGTTTLADGEGIFAYMLLDTNSDTAFCGGAGRDVTWDEETYIKIDSLQSCPPTNANVSLIHETASHVVEAITDRCLTVKSDYYGRTDSEPYAAAADGCGSLRVLTSGLRLRNAETPKHFLSLKEVFDGLNAIDNIGMSVETDVVRIEPVEYFYQDELVLSLPYIPTADYELQEEMAYSLVKIGYDKWETENVNGLDEFNSNKEFRSTLKSIDNTLDQTSNFIAGGYPIEHTRQQSFADTGAADTKYDNDTFIICVTRLPYAYGNDYAVEQGNINNASGMFSPATAYNWRIRPMYNLMRWWKSIAQSYVNLANSASKFFFSAGTGNLTATGDMIGDPCAVDAVTKPENGDLARTDMITGQDPIWKPETVNIRYPMSLKEYNLVKANPYGYIYFQCGTGDYEKGYIVTMNYRVAKGEVEMTLKLKYGI